MLSRHVLTSLALVCASTLWSLPLAAQCPVGQEIKVDNDIAGSGYSETRAQNWLSRPVGSCHGSYRYLSHTVGDGSRTGKAIWKPNITVTGWYEIRSGYRATENRTSDADYYVHDDAGGVHHKTVSQRGEEDCTYAQLGTFFCRAGGSCRVVLDGTDDGQSDAADLTIFKLIRCDAGTADAGTTDTGGGDRSRCDGIRMNSNYEVCQETSTTCAGVFTNGSGCEAFCAAAGMECVAKYGGEPACQKEPGNPLSCGQSTGHNSDWCECKGDPLPDPDPMDAGSTDTSSTEDVGDITPVDDVSGNDGATQLDSAVSTDSSSSDTDSPVPDDDVDATGPEQAENVQAQGSCACGSASGQAVPFWALVGLLALLWRGSRRHRHPG